MESYSREHKKIASILLENRVVYKGELEKAIYAHRILLDRGADITFLQFLVEEGVVSEEELQTYFPERVPFNHSSSPDGTSLNAENQTNKKSKLYQKYRHQQSESAWKSRVIATVIFLIITASLVFAYHHYQKGHAAESLLERARILKEQQKYRKAKSVLTDGLLERYPSSEVASDGRTLLSSIQNILRRKKQIEEKLGEFSAPPQSFSNAGVEEKYEMKQTQLEHLNQLYRQNKQFLTNHFGASSDSNGSGALLEKIKERKETLRNQLANLSERVFRKKENR